MTIFFIKTIVSCWGLSSTSSASPGCTLSLLRPKVMLRVLQVRVLSCRSLSPQGVCSAGSSCLRSSHLEQWEWCTCPTFH
ncbi:hypothetical protein F5141DRAFT_8386 [Pisolithus sp. B1]|nr:hypothetical protein F5141DRAFT_8386 [Pisolithus sp. B1]